jgi:hypothetical protein
VGVLVDLMVNTMFDPPMGELRLLLGIVGSQMVLLMVLVLMVFLLMARTRLFRAGQVSELMSEYRNFLGITVVHFLLFFGTRTYRVVRQLPATSGLVARPSEARLGAPREL